MYFHRKRLLRTDQAWVRNNARLNQPRIVCLYSEETDLNGAPQQRGGEVVTVLINGEHKLGTLIASDSVGKFSCKKFVSSECSSMDVLWQNASTDSEADITRFKQDMDEYHQLCG